MLSSVAMSWPADPLTADCTLSDHTSQLCGKTSPEMFHSMLSGEDELQNLISDMVSDVPETPADPDMQFWNWGNFDSLQGPGPGTGSPKHLVSPGSAGSGSGSGSEAVVPNLDARVTMPGMSVDQANVLSLSPQTHISQFFFDENVSPMHTSRTPEPYPSALSRGVFAARALSYDDPIGKEHGTPPHSAPTRRSTVPKTPQKNRKRAAKTSAAPSPSRVRAKRAEKEPTPSFDMDDDELGGRTEKSKQSARDCRRRKKMYIEAIQRKSKEYADRQKKRAARIRELQATIGRLERVARGMGLDPSMV
eukprot:m.199183 g.199183  ORF g.199183 m.199183 type:complete len:306 (-) comp25163_c0_seq2:1240-2157(-)